MLLYHGSKTKIESIEKRQARAKLGVDVPEDELQNAIYFTPSRETAIAMASRPEGLTKINDNEIWFENPEKFNPDLDIYIYTIDSDKIDSSFLKQCEDENQFVYLGDNLMPENTEKLKAIEVAKYFKLLNWKSKEESKVELGTYFKMK